MKSSVFAFAALVAGVSAYANDSMATSVYYLTTTVTALTTYCPGPTVLTHGSLTSTITEATTVTITDCPCTAVIPITVSSSVACATCAVPTSAPISNSTGTTIPSFHNNTISSTAQLTSAPPGAASPTTAVVTSPSPSSTSVPFTGAANVNKAVAASGAGLAGLLGFVAYVL